MTCAAALELARDALGLIHEEDHDVKNRLLEMDDLRRPRKLAPQGNHLIEEHLEAFHLHFRAREAVEQRAVLLFRLQELAEQDADRPPGRRPCRHEP